MEPIRLVIWDLDETYWHGTLSEGGIREYVRAHHEIVVALCRRGIMCSICSKNDEAPVRRVLEAEGIWDYFIFPSIDWSAKAARISSIIENVQLRAPTVMFIDDNALNRAEAASFIQGLQVEDETFIPKILSDDRFRGKVDDGLTRLAQYKLLETRQQEKIAATGTNEDFLRSCGVRVLLEFDVKKNIDRAIELINRTNQLNFTKVRLSEDQETARSELATLLEDPFRQTALIRVVDKYGDYGFVGFYMVRNGIVDGAAGRLVQRLEHFCFSCRTLGMLIEAWMYEHLQRPQINIVGEVLTDLSVERRVDWVQLGDGNGSTTSIATEKLPEIRIHGGCEANSVAHYLTGGTHSIVVTGNFHSGISFSRVNGATLLISSCLRDGVAVEAEALALGIPTQLFRNPFFSNPPPGTVFIVGAQLDVVGTRRYRHKNHGWEIFVEPHGLGGVDIPATDPARLASLVEQLPFDTKAKQDIAKVAFHLNENYISVAFDETADLHPAMASILNMIPAGSRLIFMTDHSRVRISDTEVKEAPWSVLHDESIRRLLTNVPYADVVSFKDMSIADEEVKLGGNHYDRLVYLRMANAISQKIKELPPKE